MPSWERWPRRATGCDDVIIVETGGFAAALAADVYAASLGRRIGQLQPAQVTSAVEPGRQTPEELTSTQPRLQLVQWAVPALLGLNIALAAKMGEQQRPTSVLSGLVRRFDPRR